MRAFRRGKAQQAGERHRQIQAIGNQVVIDLRFDAGPGQDQRHAHDVLIQGAVLIEHAVVATHIPVVAGEDDERIPQIDVPQNAANRVVNLRNHAIIARDLARHFRPGHGLQVPVPGLLLVREGLVFECIVPAGPFGDGGRIVHAGKRRARAAGQMRHADVHKQMPRASLRADELDGAIRQPMGFGLFQRHGAFAAQPAAGVLRAAVGILRGADHCVIAERFRPVRGRNVPFADEAAGIAHGFECPGPGAFRRNGRRGEKTVVPVRAEGIRVPSRIERLARGRAHRQRGVGAREPRACLRQSV